MIVISYNTCWYVFNFRLPLIRALKAQGYEVTVLAPRDEFTERICAENISYRELTLDGKGKNPFREIATVFAFIRAYRELRPEIVLQYTIKPNVYGSIAAALLGIPAICTITGLGEAFTGGGVTELLARFLYRLSFSRVSRVFFQNKDDRTLFIGDGLVREEQGELIPGSGVDTQHFAPLPKAGGAFTFLQIGRLLKAKGVETFIGAARIVKQVRPDVRFALLGRFDPEDKKSVDPAVLKASLEAGFVEYWGETDDIRPFIARSDCVVLPSYYREGVPRTLLEAASMGKPLVAANAVGTRVPIVEGKNGYLHEAKNEKDLAAKLMNILALDDEQLAAMGRESRLLMKECFEESIVTAAYLRAVERFRLGF